MWWSGGGCGYESWVGKCVLSVNCGLARDLCSLCVNEMVAREGGREEGSEETSFIGSRKLDGGGSREAGFEDFFFEVGVEFNFVNDSGGGNAEDCRVGWARPVVLLRGRRGVEVVRGGAWEGVVGGVVV